MAEQIEQCLHHHHHHHEHPPRPSGSGSAGTGVGAGAGGVSSAAKPMAAIASITNPVSQDKYVVFYNDSNNLLAQAQQFKTDLGAPLFDTSLGPSQDVPPGNIANPSSLTTVLFQSQINTYGVLAGITKGDLLICRLCPGFQLLNTTNTPLATSSSIAACSDGNQTGYLFFLVLDPDGYPQVNVIRLPGTDSTSTPTSISLSLNPTTYLGAAYGAFAGKAADAFVGVQTHDNQIHVYSRATEQTIPINEAHGMTNTPIVMLFVGNSLVVYYFGVVGGGVDPDASPLYRAETSDFTTFTFSELDSAPSPNGYTQLAALSNPAAANNGLGTVILTYVQKDSNQLVSWEDDLSHFKGGKTV